MESVGFYGDGDRDVEGGREKRGRWRALDSMAMEIEMWYDKDKENNGGGFHFVEKSKMID